MTLNVQMINLQKIYYVLKLSLRKIKVHMIFFASYIFTKDITNEN